MKEMSDKLGKEYNGEDGNVNFVKARNEKKLKSPLCKFLDVEVTVKTAEPPKISYKAVEGKPEKGVSFSITLDITMKVRPGADDEKVMSAKHHLEGELSMK